jgi:hypothetical protein
MLNRGLMPRSILTMAGSDSFFRLLLALYGIQVIRTLDFGPLDSAFL